MRGALTLALAVFAGAAHAQDWATVENCTVEEPAIEEVAFAPDSLDAVLAAAAAIPNGTGKFWEITAPSGAVSYLWGTFHSSDTLILDLPEEVMDAIEASRAIAVEIDFTYKSRDAYREAQMMEGRFREPSDPFAALLPKGNMADLPPVPFEWVRDRAIEMGWTEDFDLVMSLPGLAEMLLSDPCEDFRQGILPIQDDYIQLLGRLAGAEIIGLEAPDAFIEHLKANEDVAEAIIHTYAAYLNPKNVKAARSTSFAIYLEGRLSLWDAWDRSYQMSVYGEAGLETLRLTDAYLIGYRNERFYERLQDELPKGGVFIAIGAGHIAGEIGMVELLRAEGYEVTRIPLPGEAP